MISISGVAGFRMTKIREKGASPMEKRPRRFRSRDPPLSFARLVLSLELGDDAGVGQRRGVAQGAAFGDVLEEAMPTVRVR
jgi:hypothetical protein